LRQRQREVNLFFEGDAIFGDHYAEVLSQAMLGLGLVTRRFSELHTTRTFEIPACGTALVTQDNAEIRAVFGEGDVVFFEEFSDLAGQCRQLLQQPELLRELTARGHQRVVQSGCHNDGMVQRVLTSLGIREAGGVRG
jgi:spore maturation protein CgeB